MIVFKFHTGKHACLVYEFYEICHVNIRIQDIIVRQVMFIDVPYVDDLLLNLFDKEIDIYK